MKKTFLHLLISTIFLSPVLLLAQPIGLENPIGVDSISGLIRIVVKVIRYVAIPFVVIMIMYAGFLYLMSGAFPNSWQRGEAHKAIQWTTVGSFIILSAELIAIVMENTIKTLGR